jgi:hypothetical protein
MNRCTLRSGILLVVAIVSSQALVSRAAVVTVPAGLSPGDEYRLVFLTSTMRDAESSVLADYNAFVLSAALSVPELAALGTTWSVIGSASGVDARDNTGTNPTISSGVPFYRLDGVLAASNNQDLWDGSPAVAIDVTELGDVLSGRGVWTGTDTDGTTEDALGSGAPSAGGSIVEPLAEYLWIKHFIPAGASEPMHFYAVSGVLTVVPEPGSVVLGSIGLVTLVGWRLRRRKSGQQR